MSPYPFADSFRGLEVALSLEETGLLLILERIRDTGEAPELVVRAALWQRGLVQPGCVSLSELGERTLTALLERDFENRVAFQVACG